MLADSHVHLEQYPAAAQGGLVQRAHAAGVDLLLAVSLSLASSRRTCALAREWPGVYAAVGVHPRRLRAQRAEQLRGWLSDPRVRAIGEVGLDYAPAAAAPGVQQAFLSECLDLAEERGRALVLHAVGEACDADALSLLKRRSGPPVIVHYFVGDERLAAAYLDAGCTLSVGKPVLREAALRGAVRTIPSDRLLLETDSYPLPGRTTEPRDLVAVCQAVAELRRETPEAVAASTSRNLERVLGMLYGHADNGPGG